MTISGIPPPKILDADGVCSSVRPSLVQFKQCNRFVFLSLSLKPFTNLCPVLARYLLIAAGAETSTWNVRGLAVGVFTIIVISAFY